MNFKKYIFLSLVSFFSLIPTNSQAQQASNNDDTWKKDAKDVAAILHREYVAPALLPVVIELRKKGYTTQQEALATENEMLNMANNKASLENHNATYLSNLNAYWQQSRDPEAKENCEIIKKNFSKMVHNFHTEHNTSQEKEPTNKSQEKTAEELTEKKDDAAMKEDVKADKNGLISKIGSILFPPAVLTAIDTVAQTCGPQAAANFVGTNIPFFAERKELLSRSLVVAGFTATCVALYNIYNALTSDENSDDDEEADLLNLNFSK